MEKKLVAYITASLPDREFSVDLALALGESGVDSLEIGIPFSDPVADGPIIELANLKSLKSGFKMDDIFYISQKIGKRVDTLWMGYFNPFYNKGVELFLQKAKELCVSGFIIPDLPFNEAQKYRDLFAKYDIALISFVAPTNDDQRVKELSKESKKFIYLVAYAGITGATKSEDLSGIIKSIRDSTNTPIYLGFGVNALNAKEKSKDVDGVIVGSEFVKILLDEGLTKDKKLTTICALSKEIKEKINS